MLNIHSHNYYNSKDFENIVFSQEEISKTSDNEEIEENLCRICFMGISETDKNNIGVTVCNCSGSMQYSHLSCLKKWLKKKIKPIIVNENITIFEASELCCEICLCQIPTKVLIGGVEYSLLEFNDRYKNFIIVKDISNGLISVLNLCNQNEFYVGKSEECDLFVSHDTVDDLHCKLFVFNGRIFIEDCKSKNKTYLKINDEFVLNPFVDKYNFMKRDYHFMIKFEKDKFKFDIFSLFCNIGNFFLLYEIIDYLGFCKKPSNKFEYLKELYLD